jgi:hypothetical protein
MEVIMKKMISITMLTFIIYLCFSDTIIYTDNTKDNGRINYNKEGIGFLLTKTYEDNTTMTYLEAPSNILRIYFDSTYKIQKTNPQINPKISDKSKHMDIYIKLIYVDNKKDEELNGVLIEITNDNITINTGRLNRTIAIKYCKSIDIVQKQKN